jgi:dipeptidyl aminopeptidase/acylaminoacyl peptidase
MVGIRGEMMRNATWMVGLFSAAAFGQFTYQKPPQPILDVLNAPLAPAVSLNPTYTHMMLIERERYPSISEVAQPMLRLAGARINPRTNGPHRVTGGVTGLRLRPLAGGAEIRIALPPGASSSAPIWSPDGTRFALLNTTATGIELWVGSAATGAVRRIETGLNTAFTAGGAGGPRVRGAAGGGGTVDWMPDNRTLLAPIVPPKRGAPPAEAAVPKGPNVQESEGRAGPVRTLQDLLRNAHDEALYEHYATALLELIDTVTGKKSTVGAPGIYPSVSPAPDGKHLLVSRIRKPYSYLLGASAFPRDVEVWDLSGKPVYKLASLPLQDRVPIDGVPTGPRAYHWRPTEPATLVWMEALDGGDPRKKVAHRDRIVMLKAPFTGQPVEIHKTEHRASRIGWLEAAGLALAGDFDRNRRWARTYLVNVDRTTEAPKLLWSLSAQDRYRDPGTPVMRLLPSGHAAIRMHGDSIYLEGDGASPEGDRPFLDRYNVKTSATERLFRSEAKGYEDFVALLADDGSKIVTQRESPAEPPNYYVRTLKPSPSVAALTEFKDPVPQIRGIKKEIVTYKRADGVPLSFTLYLPADYKPGTRLPAVVWAYPREFNDPETAGQIGGSSQRFTSIGGPSHLFFLLAGYAILDGASLPVIGDPETMNNTYLEQISSGAKAAIDQAAEMGVADPNRVGVGGHSYGGFMTGNLLAHTDLFRAGIARSGAHNRTLTPFGFQAERRTIWEAPEAYLRMSPFMYANKINEPILLIHGELDNNAGTFPIQSERMYQAVRGNGGVARLVMLPNESHGYAARESIEHVLWEQITWFNRHVKDAPPRSLAGR